MESTPHTALFDSAGTSSKYLQDIDLQDKLESKEWKEPVLVVLLLARHRQTHHCYLRTSYYRYLNQLIQYYLHHYCHRYYLPREYLQAQQYR
jgi:hypothetical protein